MKVEIEVDDRLYDIIQRVNKMGESQMKEIFPDFHYDRSLSEQVFLAFVRWVSKDIDSLNPELDVPSRRTEENIKEYKEIYRAFQAWLRGKDI